MPTSLPARSFPLTPACLGTKIKLFVSHHLVMCLPQMPVWLGGLASASSWKMLDLYPVEELFYKT